MDIFKTTNKEWARWEWEGSLAAKMEIKDRIKATMEVIWREEIIIIIMQTTIIWIIITTSRISNLKMEEETGDSKIMEAISKDSKIGINLKGEPSLRMMWLIYFCLKLSR